MASFINLYNTKYKIDPRPRDRGSTASVYYGYFINDNNDHIYVAIKKINMNKLPEKMIKYISREINILKDLDHINIVKMYDNFIIDDGIVKYQFIIFEWLSNITLNKYIDDNKCTIPEKKIKDIFKQIIYAIKYLDSKNIIHRDLKPANMLFTEDMATIKIIDFGFSRKNIENNNPLMETICGSPLYMAPEIMLTKKYDKSIDIWSLGSILYQLFLGEPPYSKCTDIKNLALQWKSQKLPDDLNNLPYEVNNLIKKMLTFDPVNRINYSTILKNEWLNDNNDNDDDNDEDLLFDFDDYMPKNKCVSMPIPIPKKHIDSQYNYDLIDDYSDILEWKEKNTTDILSSTPITTYKEFIESSVTTRQRTNSGSSISSSLGSHHGSYKDNYLNIEFNK
jgi:serine/threonine protein kinase